MNNKIESFIGLDYKQIGLLIKESCFRIDRMSNTLLSMERGGMLLSMSYCREYELLLLERLDMCRKLSEFYHHEYMNSSWFFRIFASRRFKKACSLHRETLWKLMMLRNYVALHKTKGKI